MGVRLVHRLPIPRPGLARDGSGYDSLLIDRGLGLFAIATRTPGVSGDWAADEALRALAAHVRAHAGADRRGVLVDGIKSANERVYEGGMAGAACTLAALSLRDERAVVAQVGDDAVLLFRRARLRLVNTPHLVLRSDLGHVGARLLGRAAGVDVDVRSVDLDSDDTWLLASGAIAAHVGDAGLHDALVLHRDDPAECTRTILRRAAAVAGSAVVVRLEAAV